MVISFFVIMSFSLVIALFSKRGHGHPDAKDFFVASGQFGVVLFFFLSVGETYSIASMLGFPGGVYARGDGFVAWFFGYILLAAPVVYFIGPWIWRAGNLYKSATIADFFRSHFESRLLEFIVASASILLLVPIGATQFLGLKLVLTSFGWPVPPVALAALGGFVAFSYIAIAGLRASAYVSVLKDLLMLASILMVSGVAIVVWRNGAAVPPSAPLAVTVQQLPQDRIFAVSTIILQSLGFAMVPQTWAFIFSARSVGTIRRAQIAAPLYMVMFPLLMCVAYFARSHDVAPSSPDYVFLATARSLLPGWLAGVVMAAATLSGLVVLSSVCLAIGPLVSRNIFSKLGNDAQRRGAKMVIAVYLVFSVLGAEGPVRMMTTLNNYFYFGIVQTLPGLLAALYFSRASKRSVMAGMLSGYVLTLLLTLSKTNIGGLNAGLIGLTANFAILVSTIRLWPRAKGLSVLEQLRRREARSF